MRVAKLILAVACLSSCAEPPTAVDVPSDDASPPKDSVAFAITDAARAWLSTGAGVGGTIGVLDSGRTPTSAFVIAYTASRNFNLRATLVGSEWRIHQLPDSPKQSADSLQFEIYHNYFAYTNDKFLYHNQHLQQGTYTQYFYGDNRRWSSDGTPPRNFTWYWGQFPGATVWRYGTGYPADQDRYLFNFYFQGWFVESVWPNSCIGTRDYFHPNVSFQVFGRIDGLPWNPTCDTAPNVMSLRYRIDIVDRGCVPSVTIGTYPSNVTAEGSYQFIATASAGSCGGPFTYAWYRDTPAGSTTTSCGSWNECWLNVFRGEPSFTIKVFAFRSYGFGTVAAMATRAVSVNIPPPPPPPPPPVMHGLYGPTTIQPNQTGTWSASASGTGTLAYLWYINGNLVQDSFSQTFSWGDWQPSSYYQLMVTAVDHIGQGASATIGVSTDYSGSCPPYEYRCTELVRVRGTETAIDGQAKKKAVLTKRGTNP
jgi:hypothetical protein